MKRQEISSPPGKSISHLAEIESPWEEIIPLGGDSIWGRFRFGSPAAPDPDAPRKDTALL